MSIDYKEEGIKIAVETMETLVVKFTPDSAIKTIDELVHIAVYKDMTGEEKAKWVLEQAIELVEDVWEIFLPILIELLYKVMMGFVEDFRNGN